MAFFIRTQQIRHVFGFEIINLYGNVQLTSDGSKISSIGGAVHSDAAARSADTGRPVIAVKEGSPPVRPSYYSEAYLPVIVDGHPRAIVAAYVDLTEQRPFPPGLPAGHAGLGAAHQRRGRRSHDRLVSRTKEKQQADRRIRFLAHHDALTSLANRAQLIEKQSAARCSAAA